MITRLLRQRSRICPPPNPCSPIGPTVQRPSARRSSSAVSRHASHPMPSIVFSTATILSCTDNATGSRTCSHASKKHASTPVTTSVLTPSCRRSPSLQPSSSGSMSADPRRIQCRFPVSEDRSMPGGYRFCAGPTCRIALLDHRQKHCDRRRPSSRPFGSTVGSATRRPGLRLGGLSRPRAGCARHPVGYHMPRRQS